MFQHATSSRKIGQVDLGALERALMKQLLAQGESPCRVKIWMLGGRVFLDGVVGCYPDKILAERTCTALAPNIPTVNRLRVAPDFLAQPPQSHQTNLRAS
jgi:hypothetical protein